MTHTSAIIASFGVLALSAVTVEGALATSQSDLSVRPIAGEYRMTTEMSAVDAPGFPPEMAPFMGEDRTSTTEYCLTPEQADRSVEEAMRQSETDGCVYESLNVSGGDFDAVLVCDTDDGNTRMEFTGKVGHTASVINTIMRIETDSVGPMTMRMTIRQERIGDCDE